MLKANDINTLVKRINGELSGLFGSDYPAVIYESMGYSICAGGKRIRPLLLLGACDAASGCFEKAIPFALAIELIHAYSLIHDDLPAMDDDDLRRGKPTNHRVYGEAMAILAGDGLLNMAYEIMLDACKNGGADSPRFIRGAAEIASAAGVKGMIGGQVVDIISEGRDVLPDELLYIHSHKTGAIITAALTAGAIIGGADDGLIDLYRAAGKKLGVAFQIKDDILDIYGDVEKLGKSVNSDKKNNKATYLSVFGLEKAKADYQEACEYADNFFNKIIKSEFLTHLARAIANRES